ncbi:MAG TPA: hypothetical protein VGN20_00130 [Mucilaginibacter sp.]|jgi:uncharacterized membrane protein YczE
MKKKTLFTISLLLTFIALVYFICVHVLTYSYTKDRLSSGYSFGLSIGWWEILLLIILIAFMIYLIRKIKKH